jgi:hypothetical protein
VLFRNSDHSQYRRDLPEIGSPPSWGQEPEEEEEAYQSPLGYSYGGENLNISHRKVFPSSTKSAKILIPDR